ncbi:energy transducer TonB family protein [Nitratireductor luteus]|uniref:energy transducer TonB family protein n=1 Tax=Nitratireductor luteus TaxID=2976980 RepID=UPI002240408A|nr:energy transducer TonB [Nitratireductor luteus]
MRRGASWKWAAALVLSGVLHAGAVAYVLPSADEVKIAGGSTSEIAIEGSAFADMITAGAPAEIVEAEAQPDTTVTPVEPDATAIDPVEQSVTQTTEVTPEPVQPPEADMAELVTPEVQPVEQIPKTADTVPVEAVEPKQAEETVAALANVPRPTPRPAYTPPKPVKQAAAPARRKAATPPPAKKSAGAGGNDERSAKKGSAGQARSGASGGEQTARATRQGNAAVSNYPGKVVSKLRRALRYPRQAKRDGLRGEARVAFTISRNGSVSGIRIVRSSGSPVLDQAAVETVRRAAPFPAIPGNAGRASWPFTVPLAFAR